MKIGDTVKIEVYKFGEWRPAGTAQYVGKEKLYVSYNHGVFLRSVPKFKFRRGYILGSDCRVNGNAYGN